MNDNDQIAIEARRQSATVRAQLGRIRNSIEVMEDRARSISEPRRRELLVRCANAIVSAYQVREAAAKIGRTATNTPFLILTEQETTSIMGACKQHVDRLTTAYLGLSPIQTAIAIGEIMEMAKAPAKSAQALRGAAARASFDAAKAAIRQKRWTTESISAIKRAGADEAPQVSLIASSTSIDLESDCFTVSALKDMQRDMLGHAAFIQHRYDPLDIFGMITAVNISKSGDKHLLRMIVDVATANEKARNVYALIKSGVRLGASVGVIVLSGAPDKDNPKVFAIDHVKGLETSVVGLPANWEDGWVQSAKTAKAAS